MAELKSKVSNLSGKQKAAGGSLAALAMILGTIALEGGWVNDKDDPGGETNMGVTKTVAVQHGYTGPMKKLPEETAISIYYKSYLVKPGYEPLIAVNAPVAEELFDTAVNMGPNRPSRWFQQTINEVCNTKLTVDGQVGPGTREAFTKCQVTYGSTKMCITFLNKLDAKQEAEYERLIRNNPVLAKYRRGWLNNRVGNVPRSHCEVKYAYSVG